MYAKPRGPADRPLCAALGHAIRHAPAFDPGLAENGLEEDTLVVFTSDNGFLFGDHGLIDKRNAYQPSVLVPFIAYQPGTIPAGGMACTI